MYSIQNSIFAGGINVAPSHALSLSFTNGAGPNAGGTGGPGGFPGGGGGGNGSGSGTGTASGGNGAVLLWLYS
jgi:hypothetical protein